MKKRIIGLVLVLTMLAVIIPPLSALAEYDNTDTYYYDDVSKYALYYDAVNVLTVLDIISGFEDGTYRPDELVTRAQFTKLVVEALNERDQAEANESLSKFYDVSSDHWARGYINQGVKDGFIAGYSDDEFGPEDNVTYIQATKMLVCATGYELYSEGAGGYPNGYKMWGYELGICDVVQDYADNDMQLTRGDAAIMIYNAMNAPLCVIESYETMRDGRSVPKYKEMDGKGKDWQTLFTKMHDVYVTQGYINQKNEFTITNAQNFNDEYFPSGSDESINVYWKCGAPNRGHTVTAYIEIDEDDYCVLYATDRNGSYKLGDEDIGKDDSVYTLTKEHIAIDDKTLVHYTDNIILAFVEDGLKNAEKDDIASIVNGDIVAQLSGGINLLQIEVEKNDLQGLKEQAEKLMRYDWVQYATPDILSNCNNTALNGNSYEGEDEWWYKAIGADKVWNKYDDYINGVHIGEIECGTILSDHNEYAGRIQFAIANQRSLNDEMTHNDLKEAGHATSVAGILCASRDDDVGISGIANNSDIIFATLEKYNEKDIQTEFSDYFESFGSYQMSAVNALFLVKKEIEGGAKVINCSFAARYYNKQFFDQNRNNEEYKDDFAGYNSYESYRAGVDAELIANSRITCMGVCQLINNGKDFLIVQGAGNGENNDTDNPGVDATYSGYWGGIIPDFKDIYDEFGLSYNEVKNRIMVVGAVDNNIKNGDYVMSSWSNYGSTVDICAPGGAYTDRVLSIKSCNSLGVDSYNNEFGGTSAAAPMVAASAAVLWGIDESLTAEQVKGRLIAASGNAIDEDKHTTYPMLNLCKAVENLLHSYSVCVLDKSTGDYVHGASVKCNNHTYSTDVMGLCDLYAVDGTYTIDVSKDGYKNVSTKIELAEHSNSKWDDVPIIYIEKTTTEETEAISIPHDSMSTGDYIDRNVFVDKYNYAELIDNSVSYDLDFDGMNDNISTNEYTTYSEDIGENCNRYELIINGRTYHIADIRHGQYDTVFITDIDQTDDYLDIVLVNGYKGDKWAEIYRFDGDHLIGLTDDSNYNFFPVYWNEVDNNRDTDPDIELLVTDSYSGTIGFMFTCDGEMHNYIKKTELCYIET